MGLTVRRRKHLFLSVNSDQTVHKMNVSNSKDHYKNNQPRPVLTTLYHIMVSTQKSEPASRKQEHQLSSNNKKNAVTSWISQLVCFLHFSEIFSVSAHNYVTNAVAGLDTTRRIETHDLSWTKLSMSRWPSMKRKHSPIPTLFPRSSAQIWSNKASPFPDPMPMHELLQLRILLHNGFSTQTER